MKKILYVLVGLVALYLILCLFGKSNSKVERSIDINVSADVARDIMHDMKFFHDHWSPWTEKDPNMKVTYTGEKGVAGNIMAWDSQVKEVGKGSMTYNYTHGDTIMYTLHFDDYGDSKVYHVVTAKGESTNVSWVMESKTPFIFRAMMLFMNMDAMIGPDFEKGLNKLKASIESLPAKSISQYEIKEMDWDSKTFYGIKGNMTFDKLAAFFGQSYGKIGAIVGKAKVQAIGAPKAIYFTFDEKTMVTDVAAVIEVPNGTKLEGLEKFERPAGKVLLIEYYGAYDKSGDAHHAMDSYMKEKGITQSMVLEEYVTDPMSEKDTAKWLTNIFYLIK